MKKKLARILAVVLVAMMLIPVFATLAARADTANASTLVNLYDADTEFKNAVPDPANYGNSLSANGHRGCVPFDVKAGDTIYFGPSDPTQQWHLALYTTKTSAQTANRKSVSDFTKVASFDNGSAIYSYTIPTGVVAVAYAHKQANYDQPTLITVNQYFGVSEYNAHFNGGSTQGPNISDGPDSGYEGLWNYFPKQGEYNAYLKQHGNNTFVSSVYIPVAADDVLYIGALNKDDYLSKPTKTSEHHVLVAFDAAQRQLATVMLTSLKLVESIGYDYGIYSYTVPETIANGKVAFIKVFVHEGIYNDGDMLVTKNQPFSGEELRATLGINELSEEAKAHPFYGKKALFIGDSISYGSYDTPPTYRNPSASWARRLALTTGLVPTNVSYPGASIAKTNISGVKWANELLSPEMISRRTYDMIVFHGGVNDARQGVEAGVAASSDTPINVLNDEERLATFAGGLQYMFHQAKKRWPDAELYYVANYKLVSESLKGKDMNEYLTQAKILCAEYGVHYIDLFDDETLYGTFDYTSKSVLEDLLHPSGPSYDLLFPTILRLFNETIPKEDNKEEDPENTTPEETTPSTPEQTTPEAPEDGDTPNDDTPNGDTNDGSKQGLSVGAIIGIAAAAAAVAAGAFAVYWFIIKKNIKKKK